jgi:putative flippase GtrA
MIGTVRGLWRVAINRGYVRHYGGFVLAGVAALVVDTVMLALLTRGAGASPFVARPFGIAMAMVVSFLINRTVTFQAPGRPSFVELSRFAGVSITSQVVNYAVFAGLLVLWPRLVPELALFLACFVSMFVSYVGFRFGVFGAAGPKVGDNRR